MIDRATLMRWGLAVFICSATGPSSMAGDSDTAAARQTAVGTGRLRGRVMKSWDWPANGRVVHLKGHDPVTIKDGRFTFARVPKTYDLWVGHEEEAQVTAYRGLTRRDPLLQHHCTFVTARDEPAHRAAISGILRGDFPFPMEKNYLLNFSFLAKQATGFWQMYYQSEILGPRFGRMRVVWNGTPSVRGLLVVLGSHSDKDQHTEDFYLASRSVDLTDRAETTTELTLAHIPIGHIAGEIKVPYVYSWNGQLIFRLSDNRGQIGLVCPLKAGRYDCAVPDLSALGGDYCMSIIDGRGKGSEAQHCGGKIGMTDFSLTVEKPPKLHPLDKPGLVTAQTVLSWSGDEKAVYALDIRPDIGRGIKWFEFTLYTSGTRLAWKDLKGYGIETPAGQKFKVSVSRLFPYRTVDEIASTSGPISTTVEHQYLASDELEITVTE